MVRTAPLNMDVQPRTIEHFAGSKGHTGHLKLAEHAKNKILNKMMKHTTKIHHPANAVQCKCVILRAELCSISLNIYLKEAER